MSVGPLTVDRHRQLVSEGVTLHVYHNGVDVTTRCKYADDTPEANVAVLFKLNNEGNKYIDKDTGEPAMETVHGIEIREGAPFNA